MSGNYSRDEQQTSQTSEESTSTVNLESESLTSSDNSVETEDLASTLSPSQNGGMDMQESPVSS